MVRILQMVSDLYDDEEEALLMSREKPY